MQALIAVLMALALLPITTQVSTDGQRVKVVHGNLAVGQGEANMISTLLLRPKPKKRRSYFRASPKVMYAGKLPTFYIRIIV